MGTITLILTASASSVLITHVEICTNLDTMQKNQTIKQM